MKNLITLLGLFLLGSVISISTSKIKVDEEIKKDKAIDAEYIMLSNKHKRIFGSVNDTINKNR